MSTPVHERLLIHGAPGPQKAAEKTVIYERSIETTSEGSTKKIHRQTHNYRPTSLRPLPLALIFLLNLTLIGVLEWAIIRWPHHSVLDEVHHASAAIQSSLSKRSSDRGDILHQRAVSASASGSPVTTTTPPQSINPPSPSTPAVTSTSDSVKPFSTPGAESGNAFVRSKSVLPPPPARLIQSNIDKGLVHSTGSSEGKQKTSAKEASPTGTGNAGSDGDSNGNGGSDEKTGTGSAQTETGKPQTGTGSSQTGTGGGIGTGSPTAEVSKKETGTGTDKTVLRSDKIGTEPTGTGIAAEITNDSKSPASADDNAPPDLHSPNDAVHTNSTGRNDGTAKSTGVAAAFSSSASGARLVAAASASAYIISHGPGTGIDNHQGQYHKPLGAGGTFASSYLPILSAVLYRMLWSIIWNSFTLVEPFRLLARPKGASASVAFFSAYQSNPSLWECVAGQSWALGIVTLASSFADLLPALASESVFVNTDWPGCPNRNPLTPQNPCPRRVEVLVAVIRTTQAILAFAGVVLLWLLAFFYYHRTGLTSDPRSVVAVAALMGNDDLRRDFNAMPVSTDAQGMKRSLSHARYRLAYLEADSGEVRYSIEPCSFRDEDEVVSSALKDSVEDDSSEHSIQKKWHRSRDWPLDLLLIFVLLGTFAVVLAYHLDYRPDTFNEFFNSGGFGPGFILTLSATVIATLWKRAETSMMVSAPYQRLTKEPSSPDSTILFQPSTTPFASTVRALHHRYFVVAAVTIVVILSNLVLNVVIGGVAYQRGQSLRQSLVSRWLSIIILAVMMLAALALLISRLRSSRIPRQPNSLGVVMSYIAGGCLPETVCGMEHLTEDERRERMCAMAHKYQLGEREQVNGTYTWSMDRVDHQLKDPL